MLAVVKEICDHGCCEVFLVRCKATGHSLAYCMGCGASWTTPENLEGGTFSDPARDCPEGVEIPSDEDVQRSLWSGLVIEFIPEDEFSNEAKFNEAIAWSRDGPRQAVSPPATRSWLIPIRGFIARLFPGLDPARGLPTHRPGSGQGELGAGEGSEKSR
jgi:hypothetical protein